MVRMILLAAAGLSLAACATTQDGGSAADGGGAPSLALSNFEYATSGGGRLDGHYGFELGDGADWTGQLVYEERARTPGVILSYQSQSGETIEADLAIAMPYMQDGMRRFEGESDDGRAIDVRMQAGPCELSDEGGRGTHFVALNIGDALIEGCAREIASIDRWSNYLPDYMQAIETCWDEFPGGARHVTVAYPLSSQSTGVRLVDRQGERWECATRDEGSAVNAIRALDAADAMYGENDPIFVPGVMPAFGEGCYVYETVRNARGELIGAFGHDACSAGDPAS